MQRLVVICFFVCFLYLFPRNVSAISRLTIPITSHVSMVISKNQEKVTRTIQIADNLSSTKLRMNEKGDVLDSPSYYPYGTATTILPHNTQGQTNRFYTGQRKVTDNSSIYNYNARYYNPDIGLFIQPDSVEGPHRYAYVAGNPVMKNDPSGQQGERQVDDPFDYYYKSFSLFNNGKYNALTLKDQNWFTKDRDRLDDIAWKHINRNPFDAQKAPYQFTKSLVEDIHGSYPYFPAFMKLQSQQTLINFERQDLLTMPSYVSKQNVGLFSTDKEEGEQMRKSISSENLWKLYFSTYKLEERLNNFIAHEIFALTSNRRSIAENIESNSMICSTYTALTSYILAQVGIENNIMYVGNSTHAIVIMDSNGIPVVVDTTFNKVESISQGEGGIALLKQMYPGKTEMVNLWNTNMNHDFPQDSRSIRSLIRSLSSGEAKY